MKKVRGKPLLWYLLRRLTQSELIDNIVVGTPDEEIRDAIERLGFECVVSDRPEDDVLGRYVDIAEDYGADTVVRVTGDCPLIDAEITDQTIAVLGDADFSCNIWPRTFPQGLDTEVMPIETLHRLDRLLPEGDSEREHVCVHVYDDPDFSVVNYADTVDRSELRWCVDYQDDFDRIANILERWWELPYKELVKKVKWMTN